jgi:Ribosomal L28 family
MLQPKRCDWYWCTPAVAMLTLYVLHCAVVNPVHVNRTLKRNVTMRLCTSALRTIKKYGLEKAAKVYDCDLSKF